MPPSPFDAADLRARVQKALAAFVDAQAPRLAGIAPELVPVSDAITEFVVDGGKRVRPAFCYWGWRGAGGPDTEEIVAAAASLELVHACALMHDDVMDGSDTRRGRPAMHRRFAATHAAGGWTGDPDGFGRAAAILLGDLCLVWAEAMYGGSGLPGDALHRAAPVYDAMRVELMCGQYLDVLEQARGAYDVETALRVARYKTAKYTVERPLHLGARLAGGDDELLVAYSAYGVPLGEAFQLRDDVLGVFGDPSETGKPAGDDLREGKHTVLVAITLRRADPAGMAAVRRDLGNRALDARGVERLRDVIASTGALAEVEAMIADLAGRAEAALTGAVAPAAREVLTALARAATTRRA